MKVDITHTPVHHGLIFKKTHVAVTLSVVFNEEEKAIIQSRRLTKTMLLDRGPDAKICRRFENDQEYLRSLGGFELTVKTLMKGPDVYELETPVGAKNYEATLVQALTTLKGFLAGNADVPKGTSFEL